MAFSPVNQHLMGWVEAHLLILRWRGWHVVAADGTAVRLTMRQDNVHSMLQGIAFGLYLPGIALLLNCRWHAPLSNERQMFFEVIDLLRIDDLLVMDRGVPCRWLVSALRAHRFHFCIRCDSSQGFKAVREFLPSCRREQVIVLRVPDARDAEDDDCPATPNTVRLLRVTTPNGRLHVRRTSLLDAAAFPAAFLRKSP